MSHKMFFVKKDLYCLYCFISVRIRLLSIMVINDGRLMSHYSNGI